MLCWGWYSRIVAHRLEDRIIEFDGAGDQQSRVRRLRRHCGSRILNLSLNLVLSVKLKKRKKKKKVVEGKKKKIGGG